MPVRRHLQTPYYSHPPAPLRCFPPLLREGGRGLWPGVAGSTAALDSGTRAGYTTASHDPRSHPHHRAGRARSVHGFSGRPAGHRRRDDHGAVHHAHPRCAWRCARPGGQDGDRHVHGHHRVHLRFQRARAPQARCRALGHRPPARPGHRHRRGPGQPGRVRLAQGSMAGTAVRGLRQLLGHPDAQGQEAQAFAHASGHRWPGRGRHRDRFSLWPGRRRGRLRQRALHDLVQRGHPQRRGHQCRARLSDRPGQCGGVHRRRARRVWAAGAFAGLHLLACAGRDRLCQRAHGPAGREGGPRTARQVAQEGVCPHPSSHWPPTCSTKV